MAVAWTNREVETLQELWGKKSKREIGRAIGRSMHGVRYYARRLGLIGTGLRPGQYVWPEAQKDRLSVKKIAMHQERISGR